MQRVGIRTWPVTGLQTSSAYLSKVTPLVEEGKAVPLMSWGALDSQGNLIRDPSFPDLPHFAEVYESIHGKAPSGPAFEAWKAFFIPGFPAQKLVLLPKNADPEVIATYKAAFEKIANNPEFIQASKLALGAYSPATGDNIGTLYKQATAISKDDQAWVQAWLKEMIQRLILEVMCVRYSLLALAEVFQP